MVFVLVDIETTSSSAMAGQGVGWHDLMGDFIGDDEVARLVVDSLLRGELLMLTGVRPVTVDATGTFLPLFDWLGLRTAPGNDVRKSEPNTSLKISYGFDDRALLGS
jgi:hypothetical protein